MMKFFFKNKNQLITSLIIYFSLISLSFQKTKFIISVFRHSNRTNYINYKNNTHNPQLLPLTGLLPAYQSGLNFISKTPFKLPKQFMKISPNNTLCFTTSKPRAIQSLALRMMGMNQDMESMNKAIKNVGNIAFFEDKNKLICTPLKADEFLFPSKKCEKKIQEVLPENFEFVNYVLNILNNINELETFKKYREYQDHYSQRENDSIYHRLYLLADYLTKSKEFLDDEETIMYNHLKDYNMKYLDALTSNNSIMRLLIDRFYEAIFREMDNIIDFYSNNKYLFFSTHEIDLIAILKSLELEQQINEFPFDFNDSINFVLSKKKGEYYIKIFYNWKLLKLKNCDIDCPYTKFKSSLQYMNGVNLDMLNDFCEGRASDFIKISGTNAGDIEGIEGGYEIKDEM